MNNKGYMEGKVVVFSVGIKPIYQYLTVLIILVGAIGCGEPTTSDASSNENEGQPLDKLELLDGSKTTAICYGGYRQLSRDQQPSVEEIKQDMRILHAMDIRLLRTYNTTRKHAHTVLQAIDELKSADPDFEMNVMLGIWMSCENAFTAAPNHNNEDSVANTFEVNEAIRMANAYPEIVKILAVGNESMVHWQAPYFVQPGVVLKYVRHLKELRASKKLPEGILITSSDNFASWGGGDSTYHVEDLDLLIQEVDFISMHTYPMHDTHYNPEFWIEGENQDNLTKEEVIENAMQRALDYAIQQYEKTSQYVHNISPGKPLVIGETGWATFSDELYGSEGSKACDEYKSGLYYKLMRNWSIENGVVCFYFEAFDEIWKDAKNPGGSENHFGIFDLKGNAKYPIWDLVDQDIFDGLDRGHGKIQKTFEGNLESLMKTVELPLIRKEELITN